MDNWYEEMESAEQEYDAKLQDEARAYEEGYQQGRADAFNEILNEMTKSPFASDKATLVKKYIEEKVKEQKNE